MLDAIGARYGSGHPPRLWEDLSPRQILVTHDYVARELWLDEDRKWRRVGVELDRPDWMDRPLQIPGRSAPPPEANFDTDADFQRLRARMKEQRNG